MLLHCILFDKKKLCHIDREHHYFIIKYLFILKEASKPENRAKQPWIIAMGHRPMYCSNNDNNDCTHHESLVTPLFSSPEPKALVSFSGQNLSVVSCCRRHPRCRRCCWRCRKLFTFSSSPPEPLG